MTNPTKTKSQHYIDLIKAAGWRVFVRPSSDITYCYFTDGENIGYAQWSDYIPKVSSVHRPSQHGTGFSVAEGITADTLRKAATTRYPSWVRSSERLGVIKYKDWDTFHHDNHFNRTYVEV